VHTLPGGETHCTSFQTFSSTTAELAGPMAPLVSGVAKVCISFEMAYVVFLQCGALTPVSPAL